MNEVYKSPKEALDKLKALLDEGLRKCDLIESLLDEIEDKYKAKARGWWYERQYSTFRGARY